MYVNFSFTFKVKQLCFLTRIINILNRIHRRSPESGNDWGRPSRSRRTALRPEPRAAKCSPVFHAILGSFQSFSWFVICIFTYIYYRCIISHKCHICDWLTLIFLSPKYLGTRLSLLRGYWKKNQLRIPCWPSTWCLPRGRRSWRRWGRGRLRRRWHPEHIVWPTVALVLR